MNRAPALSSSSSVHNTLCRTFAWLLLWLTVDQSLAQACTTAVISGRVTVDGRPILWKNRDYASARHNAVSLLTSGKYRGVAIITAGSQSSVWMGVNEAGFCIENSLSRDLKSAAKEDGPGNGAFMKLALETCATVDDFKRLVEQTNATGRKTTGNFGVIDARGGAAMFEIAPRSYTLFDANDPAIAPSGYIVRSNFATTAHGLPPRPTAEALADISSAGRYLRACELLERKSSKGLIDVQYVLRNMARDLADSPSSPIAGSINGSPAALPEFIATDETISRDTTVSAAVFHGVRPDEDPRLTTMWAVLGDPKFSIAIPCWTSLSTIADPLEGEHGGEIGEIALLLRDWLVSSTPLGVSSSGLPGIWQDLWGIEDRLLSRTLAERESQLQRFDPLRLESLHLELANIAMQAMHNELLQAKAVALVASNSVPAIMNPSATSTSHPIRVAIYDHSDGSAKGPKNLGRFLSTENGFEAGKVTPQDIRDGTLEQFDVLIMPGGSGSSQAKHLGEDGKSQVIRFVEEGGGYVGICAGSYLASSHYSWSLGLINARVWDRAHWARGTGQVTIGITPVGASVLQADSRLIDVYYGQGPLLVPDQRPDLPAYEILATYQTEIAKKGAPAAAMQDTHAVIRSTYGQGRVICFSPHPEVESGPNALMISGVRWAASK